MTGDPNKPNEGIYAFKHFSYALHQSQRTPIMRQYRVFGTVRLWGNIVEHEFGYRAEFARIVRITDADNFNDIRPGILLAHYQNLYNETPSP